MTKDINLIEKYRKFYEKIRGLVNDNEIYPDLDSSNYEEYVSNQNWIGIPSFAMSKNEMTNSDNAHISFRLENNKLTADLFFNGVKAVNRFINILHSISEKERDKFINLVKNLNEKYSIIVQYDARVPKTSANWTPIKTIKCKDLTKEKIQELLIIIKDTMEKRNLEQKEIGRKKIVTMSISLARVEIENYNDKDLIEVFSNLANLARVVHNIKSVREINKIEKQIPKQISSLEEEISNKENHLNKIKSLKDVPIFKETDIESLEEELIDLKSKLRSLREGHTTISKQNE
jgi:hypothetical protein